MTHHNRSYQGATAKRERKHEHTGWFRPDVDLHPQYRDYEFAKCCLGVYRKIEYSWSDRAAENKRRHDLKNPNPGNK